MEHLKKQSILDDLPEVLTCFFRFQFRHLSMVVLILHSGCLSIFTEPLTAKILVVG